MNESSMRHGHPGKSCLHNASWHMIFSRELTEEEWNRIGRLMDLDPGTYQAETKTYVSDRCAACVRIVCPDVVVETVERPLPEVDLRDAVSKTVSS